MENKRLKELLRASIYALWAYMGTAEILQQIDMTPAEYNEIMKKEEEDVQLKG